MAIHDHRTFRRGDEWWVAQVHMASGAGVAGGDPEAPPPEEMRLTHDRVFFTCISNDELPSRSAQIRADRLNRLSHESLLGVLETAEVLDSRFEMSPYNAPDARDFNEDEMIEDGDGLNWAVRPTNVLRVIDGEPTHMPALELICLDDSALRDQIVFESEATLTDYLEAHGDEGKRELIEHVKGLYRDDPGGRGQAHGYSLADDFM